MISVNKVLLVKIVRICHIQSMTKVKVLGFAESKIVENQSFQCFDWKFHKNDMSNDVIAHYLIASTTSKVPQFDCTIT